MSVPEASDLGRILVVRLDNVGDAIMLSPALRALRQTYPGASITGLLSPAAASAAPLLPEVDDVIAYRAPWQDASNAMRFDPQGLLGVSQTLAERHFDAAFIFTSFSQSPWPPAYACYLAGIPIRAGESKEFGGSILSHVAPPMPAAMHQVDRNLQLLRTVGIAADNAELEVGIPDADRAFAAELLGRCGLRDGEFVLLAPGASCPARRYDFQRFAAAARQVSGWTGLRVVVVGTERERGMCDEVVAAIGSGAVDLGGRTSVPQLAAVIERSAVVLANDSGPMHLADALRRPMVILFSGTDLESQWEPRSAPATLLRRPTDCAPCYRFECPYGLPCLDIPSEEVADAAVALLAANAKEAVR